jgi:hypothetical protein
MWSELRRRRGRTILTALGLRSASPLSLWSTRSAPLTGVGTDMAVTRPIKITNNRFRAARRAPRAEHLLADEPTGNLDSATGRA